MILYVSNISLKKLKKNEFVMCFLFFILILKTNVEFEVNFESQGMKFKIKIDLWVLKNKTPLKFSKTSIIIRYL